MVGVLDRGWSVVEVAWYAQVRVSFLLIPDLFWYFLVLVLLLSVAVFRLALAPWLLLNHASAFVLCLQSLPLLLC